MASLLAISSARAMAASASVRRQVILPQLDRASPAGSPRFGTPSASLQARAQGLVAPDQGLQGALSDIAVRLLAVHLAMRMASVGAVVARADDLATT